MDAARYKNFAELSFFFTVYCFDKHITTLIIIG